MALCERMELEPEMLEPASVSNGGERVGSTIYLETDEHTELTDLVDHFGLTKSGLTRTCYRLGCALLTEQMEATPLDGEAVP